MGKFGQTLGAELLKTGNEVAVVDKDEAIINRLASQYTTAKIANCIDKENLKALDIPSYDACIVAIGDDFQSSMEITSQLNELGAKYVISRAVTEIQKKFLLRNGADEVIYPDLDIAEKVAIRLTERIHDYYEIDKDYSLLEINVPEKWIGHSITELEVRKKYNLNILTVKKNDTIVGAMYPSYVFEADSHLLVFGKTTELFNFTRKYVK